MRGDSLRDLYAKTLALCGLGLLAGAGALVDYWPVGIGEPVVSSVLPRPELAMALNSADAWPIPQLPIVRHPASFAAKPALAASSSAEPAHGQPSTAMELPVHRSSPVRNIGSIMPALAAADVVPTYQETSSANFIEPAAVSANVGTEVALTEVAIAPFEPIRMLAAVSPSADADDDGLLTGAFKKTGTSILRGGAKTGASIRDAFRAVGGAVRRALPAFDVSAGSNPLSKPSTSSVRQAVASPS